MQEKGVKYSLEIQECICKCASGIEQTSSARPEIWLESQSVLSADKDIQILSCSYLSVRWAERYMIKTGACGWGGLTGGEAS